MNHIVVGIDYHNGRMPFSENLENMDEDQKSVYLSDLYPSIFDRKLWRFDAEELNELENVKVEMDAGIVLMRKSGDWHILCAANYARWKMINTELIVDYDNMRIGVVKKSKNIDWIFDYNNAAWHSVAFTMGKKKIQIIDTSLRLGVINQPSIQPVVLSDGGSFYIDQVEDDLTNTIDFPQVTYEVDNKYFDADFNMIAEGKYIKCKPEIESFQHVHIIKILSEYLLVFKSHKAVEIVGNKIKDGDDEYYLYVNVNNKKDNFLLNANTKIELNPIGIYGVEATLLNDKMGETFNAYNGLIVPNDSSYDYIYEVDGVWLGFKTVYTFHILEPYKLQSGQNTKPSIN